MKYFIISLLFVGCSFQDEYYYSVNEAFVEYVDRFYLEAEKRGVEIQRYNLTVTFHEIESSGVGGRDGNGNIIVMIDPDSWYTNADELERHREYLMFHELGHALLSRQHTTKESIMNPKMVSQYDESNRDTFLNELFNGY